MKRIFGETSAFIFSTFEKLGDKKGLFLFKKNDKNVQLAHSPCSVFPISLDRIVFWEARYSCSVYVLTINKKVGKGTTYECWFIFESTWIMGIVLMIYWDKDRLGFPLFRIEPLDFWVQAFPVTKYQFETFLTETHFMGDAEYSSALSCNPRITIQEASASNFEGLFITGINWGEVNGFRDWMNAKNAGYLFPTMSNWKLVYRSLSTQPVVSQPDNWRRWDSLQRNYGAPTIR